MSEPSTDEREALVDVGYRAWCEARKGSPLSPGEYEALSSRIEIGWMGKITDAVLAARPAVDVDGIGDVIRSHQPTTGMSVASGVTCRCGYWNGIEEPGKTRPVGYSGLQWHQAQAVIAYLAGEGRG